MVEESVDLDAKILMIKKQPLFSQLTDEEREELAYLFAKIEATPGTTIVKEGDRVDSVYLIANGTSDVRHVTYQDGQPIVNSVAVLSTGDAIGLNETGFYSISGRRTASVVALTDMVLYRLSVAAFHGFALSHTHVSEIMRKNSSKVFGGLSTEEKF